MPYTPAELLEIAELEAGKDKHRLSADARAALGRALKGLCDRYAEHPAWSSGRVASTLYGEAKWAQSELVADRWPPTPTATASSSRRMT